MLPWFFCSCFFFCSDVCRHLQLGTNWIALSLLPENTCSYRLVFQDEYNILLFRSLCLRATRAQLRLETILSESVGPRVGSPWLSSVRGIIGNVPLRMGENIVIFCVVAWCRLFLIFRYIYLPINFRISEIYFSNDISAISTKCL